MDVFIGINVSLKFVCVVCVCVYACGYRKVYPPFRLFFEESKNYCLMCKSLIGLDQHQTLYSWFVLFYYYNV